VHRVTPAIAGIAILAGSVSWTTAHPGHARDWNLDHSRMPVAELAGDELTIRNVRNFRWGANGAVKAAWETRHYDLSRLESVWYVLTPFSANWRGPAHAFVSFGFVDGSYLSVSVEARRERDEPYSAWRGMLKRYELIYVIGDERDLVQLRANRHGDDVYMYPIRATPDQARRMLVGMVQRANRLAERPEFYGTISNNCTTNLLAHVNEVADQRISYGVRILLPGYSDRLAHDRGLIDTSLTLEEARSRWAVTSRSQRHAGSAAYSLLIRAED
jgi:hypothetical protein